MVSFRHIQVHCQDDVFCVRLKHSRLEENEIQQLGEEIHSLCNVEGCRKLAISLGPETPYCLYSVFLSRLVAIRNALTRLGGRLVLCEVGPKAMSTFEACKLQQEFTFVPDFPA